jgi:ComF family protein
LDEKQIICTSCESQLPYTQFGKMQASPVEKIFWGRVPIQHAIAVLFFTKESCVQQIIFEFKYHQNKRAGYLLGKLIALELSEQDYFNQLDYLIPIPISKARKRRRGFNQTEIICEAIIAQGCKVTLLNLLSTTKEISTQTHKDRLERGNQNRNKFTLQNRELIKGKNILLVDDVLTTGATLEAACHCLLPGQPASLRIATAAYTIH